MEFLVGHPKPHRADRYKHRGGPRPHSGRLSGEAWPRKFGKHTDRLINLLWEKAVLLFYVHKFWAIEASFGMSITAYVSIARSLKPEEPV